MSASDTIYALSTGEGRAALSVFRISGVQAGPILDAMTGDRGGIRLLRTCRLTNPLTGRVIDQAVTVWIPGPRSFTGEDCAEFHVHASPAVHRALMSALQSFPNVRLAEPGEFTRRAFVNGKLDLVEAEGLADLLSARTELQRDQALAQMLGQSSGQFETWRAKLWRYGR